MLCYLKAAYAVHLWYLFWDLLEVTQKIENLFFICHNLLWVNVLKSLPSNPRKHFQSTSLTFMLRLCLINHEKTFPRSSNLSRWIWFLRVHDAIYGAFSCRLLLHWTRRRCVKQILCHFPDESQENILPSLSFINHDRSHLPWTSRSKIHNVSKMFKKLRKDFRQSNDDTVGNIK